MKEYIKALVKESLGGLMREKENTPNNDGEKKGEDSKKKGTGTEKKASNRDQTSIELALDSPKSPPMSSVMDLAGIGDKDNAADRSRFSKEVKKKEGLVLSKERAKKVKTVLGGLNL